MAGTVLWRTTAPDRTAPSRVLPDGCLDLIWYDDALVVAGPDTTAHVDTGRPGARYVGLRFGSGLGPQVLGVPADALRDRRVPLDELWPAGLVRE
ncbi:MAG: DUF6597 domain-containing transcriptional factor, partial [Actinocatenispora sp.]